MESTNFDISNIPLFDFPLKENNTLLFRYKDTSKEVNKKKLLSFLAHGTAKNYSSIFFYNRTVKALYSDPYHFILSHLDKTISIEIYQDNAIRLNARYEGLIVFEDYDFCNAKITQTMIEELLIFVNSQ